jgi:protease PrsW
VVTLLTLVGAGIMAVVIWLSGGQGSLLWATLLAAIPVGPLVGIFLWLDRYEPEPKSLLVAGLAWGAFVATAAALVLQGIGAAGGVSNLETLRVVAPITEEATKGVFLLLLLWWRRHELDGILDGIVYAGMVGVGFAFTENIIYLAAAYDGTDGMGPGGSVALTGTFIMRCLVSPFAHPTFTALTGIRVGIAVATRRRWLRVVAPVVGYLLSVVAHGTWHPAASGGIGNFLLVYGTLMLPVFFLLAAFAVFRRRSEGHLLRAALQDAAARGLLPATDIDWLVDLRARRIARSWAERTGGDNARRAMREYQAAAVELGYLHHRFLRGTAPDDFASRGASHVARLSAVRPYISFPGQVVPTR